MMWRIAQLLAPQLMKRPPTFLPVQIEKSIMSPTIELLCGHRSVRHFTDREPVTDARRGVLPARTSTSSSVFTVQLYYHTYYRSGAARALVPLTGGQSMWRRPAEFWYLRRFLSSFADLP